MPLLTLNQARLVLRIALAYGQTIDNQRALELLGVVGAGFGFRAVARELLDLVPVAGWAVEGVGRLRRHEGGRRSGRSLLRLPFRALTTDSLLVASGPDGCACRFRSVACCCSACARR